MSHRKSDISENLPTHDQVSPASSSHQTPKTTPLTNERCKAFTTPVEYVSLFEGVTESLKEERDSRLDPYAAVFTGFNKLLVEVADYLRAKQDPPDVPPRQVITRLM